MAKDAYQTLGVRRDADKESIKLAYYALRRQFAALKKPTRAQNERLIRINTAWDILKIPERKADYDVELARLVKARHDREKATRERASAAPPPPPPPPPEPEPVASSEPIDEEAAAYEQTWQPAAPRPQRSKSVSPIVWKLGTAVGALYILASLMKPTPVVPPPVADVKVEAPAKKAPSKGGRRKNSRKARVASREIHRRAHDSQDAAELNRRELERLRSASATRYTQPAAAARPTDEY